MDTRIMVYLLASSGGKIHSERTAKWLGCLSLLELGHREGAHKRRVSGSFNSKVS
jgi:hypothetical protein